VVSGVLRGMTIAETSPRPGVRPARLDRNTRGDRGVEGNEHLTGVTGAVLILLLAVIGITILRIGQLISVHLFVGMMLLAPIALKLGSTGYRFAGYYLGRPAYRRKGPPLTAHRILAVPVVLTTLIVMISGVALLLGGPSVRGTWYSIHKFGFIAWVVFMAVHVLTHVQGAAESVRVELGPDGPRLQRASGRGQRLLLIGLVLIAGVIIAIVAIPDFGAWAHYHHHPHLT
jgi:hypothetical protein